MEMSPGLRSYKRENTFQDVPIDAAVKSPNKPFIFEDSQKQRWQITYDPKAKNGYHLNIAPHKRSVAPEMELQRAPASEIQAKLKELAHKPSSELDAVARVREDLAPVYRLSPKHVQGTVDYNNARQKQPGIVPENHVELYRNAIRSETGDYYAKDTHGNVHRFQVTNGEAHWNGATSTNTQRDKLTNPKPIEPKDLPEDIRDMWKLKQ
jgi:hypothetical protein